MKLPRTQDALQRLLALSFAVQGLPDTTTEDSKVMLSFALQEIAHAISEAHGLDWTDLVTGAIEVMRNTESAAASAEAVAASAIHKAMGHKPH